jgi:hypothetical protein
MAHLDSAGSLCSATGMGPSEICKVHNGQGKDRECLMSASRSSLFELNVRQSAYIQSKRNKEPKNESSGACPNGLDSTQIEFFRLQRFLTDSDEVC